MSLDTQEAMDFLYMSFKNPFPPNHSKREDLRKFLPRAAAYIVHKALIIIMKRPLESLTEQAERCEIFSSPITY